MDDPNAPKDESLWLRLLSMVIIGVMLSIAQTILMAAAVIQFVLMLTRQGKPNSELAWFGKRLGDWLAKAARYQTAADDEKPWPWTPLE
ncbi:MAG: DUF4389 domain-containing protein [Paracoccaceae bacterium]